MDSGGSGISEIDLKFEWDKESFRLILYLPGEFYSVMSYEQILSFMPVLCRRINFGAENTF